VTVGTIIIDNRALRGAIFLGLFLFLSIVSVSTHFFHAKYLAFIVVSFPLFFYKFNSYHFIILYSACELLFFESYLGTSYIWLLQISDACIIVYFASLIIVRNQGLSFSLPINGLLLPLYLFIGYVMVMAVGPLLKTGPDYWILWDCKRFLTLGLVAFFCVQPVFGPKRITSVLLFIVLFTTLHALVTIGKFVATHERCLTWNEIFFANISIVGVILYFFITNKMLKVMLLCSIAIIVTGMLVTQTRTIWISTVLCLAIYLSIVFKSKVSGINVKKVLGAAIAAVSIVIVVFVICKYALGIDIQSFIAHRMVAGHRNELADNTSSLGYRIYESYSIWKKRSLFGHGTGATLYLVQHVSGKLKFRHWWSIHSEYFEFLHKWGFVGLGLYGWFLYKFFGQSFHLLRSKKKFVSALGAIAFFSMLNTSIISITSGYFGRINMIFYDILIVGIVVNYFPHNMQKPMGSRPSPKMMTDLA
jgi:O-Antigen ligase